VAVIERKRWAVRGKDWFTLARFMGNTGVVIEVECVPKELERMGRLRPICAERRSGRYGQRSSAKGSWSFISDTYATDKRQ